jgi:hypothetical protein
MFEILDRIEQRIFGDEASVSPGGWSCNSCTATATDGSPYERVPDEPTCVQTNSCG